MPAHDDDRRVHDTAIDSVLRQTERTLRRSRRVLADADATLGADGWLGRIDLVLAESAPPVIDLTEEEVGR